MTPETSLLNILSQPLAVDWRIEHLAERILDAVAADTRELTLDGATVTDPQARRLIRPLVACLSVLSASEAGTTENIYTSELSFHRNVGGKTVLVSGQVDNRPGSVRLTLRRSGTSRLDDGSYAEQPALDRVATSDV